MILNFAKLLRKVVPLRYFVGRFGGDEFCMLFYTCSREEAEQVCCEIQTRFAEESVHKTCRPVSVSIGIARFETGERPSHLLQRADAALYQAKQKKGSICFDAES